MTAQTEESAWGIAVRNASIKCAIVLFLLVLVTWGLSFFTHRTLWSAFKIAALAFWYVLVGLFTINYIRGWSARGTVLFEGKRRLVTSTLLVQVAQVCLVTYIILWDLYFLTGMSVLARIAFALSLDILLILSSFVRMQFCANGIWLNTRLIKWQHIKAFRWQHDGLILDYHSGLPFFNQDAPSIPWDDKDALTALLRERVPE